MANIKLFISWSKDQAGTIAPLIKTFLSDILAIEEIFISKEIDSGRRWGDEIAQALETSDAGIIIVTQENKEAPWLHFEAGAISKRVKNANVIPLLWDLSIGDIANTPLNQFQSNSFSEDDLLNVAKTLAVIWDIPLDSVTRRFESMYPAFAKSLKEIPAGTASRTKSPTTADLFALVERIGSRVSGIDSKLSKIESRTAPAIMGQGEFATASASRAADILGEYFEKKPLNVKKADLERYRQLYVKNFNQNAKISELNSIISAGQQVFHGSYGFGMVSEVNGAYAIVQFDDGETHEVPISELKS